MWLILPTIPTYPKEYTGEMVSGRNDLMNPSVVFVCTELLYFTPLYFQNADTLRIIVTNTI